MQSHVTHLEAGGGSGRDFREAEDFDATGGTDVAFPGCGMAMVGGRTVADCGNENDFVEYFLSGDDDDDDHRHSASGICSRRVTRSLARVSCQQMSLKNGADRDLQ